MQIRKSALFALVAAVLVPVSARAQDAAGVEVTPYVAIGTMHASPVGAAVVVAVSSALSLEADVAYRRGEGDISALSTTASLLWALPSVGKATPYLAGGVGLAQVGTPVPSADGTWVATQPRLTLVFNAGGGVKVPMTDRVTLRTDARWMTSTGRYGSEQFRVAQGVAIRVGGR